MVAGSTAWRADLDTTNPVVASLEAKGKKLTLFHTIHCNGEVAATAEQLLIHVSMKTRRAAEPPAEMAALVAKIAEAHAAFGLPEGAGGTGRKG